MTAPDWTPNYLRAARGCYDSASFQKVWDRAEANGHLDDELRAQLQPIGDALAIAEKLRAGVQ